MPLNYIDLDDITRSYMLEECALDEAAGKVFLSEKLTPQGRADYPGLLISAIQAGTDESFANEISIRLNTHQKPRALKSGGFSKPPIMNSDAHLVLSEGEFNRYYIRGVCRRALDGGLKHVTIYRARYSAQPRPESEAKIGLQVSAENLLADLRVHLGMEPFLGLPVPNSGLSVHIPSTV